MNGTRRRIFAGVIAGLAAVGCPPTERPSPDEPPSRTSILALGDTGRRHGFLAGWFEGQMAVAHGMAAEDARSPVDGVVFLGDNFYGGLQRFELVERIRENLAWPYCRFIELGGPRSPQIEARCRLAPDEKNPVPILAVAGNHDLVEGEGFEAQCRDIPDFISNWNMSCDFVTTLELEGGLSIIAYNSETPGWLGQLDSLAEAIRNAKGPWRILVAHHPLGVRRDDGPSEDTFLQDFIREVGVPVHAHLAGHNHTLQILVDENTVPPLQAIAGSGSRVRPGIDQPHPNRVFGAERLGFARLDVVDDEAHPRLLISLFATPFFPILSWGEPELMARWSVDFEGHVQNELGP